MTRTATISRSTKETNVSVCVNLDGTGNAEINVKPEFFKHLLTSFSTHSLFDLSVTADGDLMHHVIEDTAIVLGRALRTVINESPCIARFGWAVVPMDCSRSTASVDVGNRAFWVIDFGFDGEVIEDMATEDIEHFVESLSSAMQACIHLRVDYGKNDHHKAESAFKALALAMRQATAVDSRRMDVPSAKGVL